MFKQLQKKLLALSLLGTGLVLLVMAVIFLSFAQRQLKAQSLEAFEKTTNAIALNLRSSNVVDHAWLAETESDNSLLLSLEVVGTPLFYSILHPAEQEFCLKARHYALEQGLFFPEISPTTLIPERTYFSYKDSSGQSFHVSMVKVISGSSWLNVTIVQSMANEEQQAQKLVLAFVLTIALGMALLTIFLWFFTKKSVLPLEKNQKRQTEFVSSASHELRSPLAVISAVAGNLPNASPEEVLTFSHTIEKECSRLGSLIRDLLLLASADDSRLSFSPALHEIETLLINTGERFSSLAREKGITLSLSLPAEILPKIPYDLLRMEQLFAILMDNAIRFTPQGGTIHLCAEEHTRQVRLLIADSGKGIPEEFHEKIFDRFFQEDASRTYKEHYGLGLSIAKEIVELHKGSIGLKSPMEGGAMFVISLPKS